MKKAMISQPMNGLTKEEILATKEKASAFLKQNGYEVVDTFFDDDVEECMKKGGVVNMGVGYLALSLAKLAMVDLLYCCKGWENARGCKFEHDVALAYGIDVIDKHNN